MSGRRPSFAFTLIALCIAGIAPAQAQLARKPSFYDQENRKTPGLYAKPAQPSPRAPAPDALPALKSKQDFEAIARVYDAGTPMELAHALFVIDRQAKPARIQFVNTPRFELHVTFVKKTGLAPNIGKHEIDSNYLSANRRFIFGTLSWQKDLQSFTYEFWEGDRLTVPLLKQADAIVKASFFGPLQFKTNSTLHERVAKEAALPFVTQEALIREQPFMPLNLGVASGRLRIVERIEDLASLGPDDIALLRQVPLGMPPVAGVITERPSTALSHVNMLAKGWGIPNAYVRKAADQYRALDGKWIELSVLMADHRLRELSPAEVAARPSRAAQPKGPAIDVPKPDLEEFRLLKLSQMHASNAPQCGSKAANLGAVKAAGIPNVSIPDGFCVPFAHYDRFMKSNGLADRLAKLQQAPGFATDSKVRQQLLAALRAEILGWTVDPATAAAWRAQWQTQLEGKGVFVRSSSNSEDLPKFSGAGLYTTVPNVKTGDGLEMAVKTVWASVFNSEAWEARRAANFAPDAVFMGVLIQTAIDSTSAGVLVTKDPFDPNHNYATYISAKRGIGIRVVEGQRVAEQVMYSSWSKAVQVLSRSADDTALQLDKNGGVKEVPVTVGRVVLTDELVVRLAQMGAAVRRVFRGVDQDIEWATVGNQIVVLQARPFIER